MVVDDAAADDDVTRCSVLFAILLGLGVGHAQCVGSGLKLLLKAAASAGFFRSNAKLDFELIEALRGRAVLR